MAARLKAERDWLTGDIQDAHPNGAGWPANMGGIRALQAASVARRVEAMSIALHGFHEERREIRPSQLARRMEELLGTRFRMSQLYRGPLATMWRDPPDYVGACADVDGCASFQAFRRMSKRQLSYHVMRMRRQISDARSVRSAKLLADSANSGEDWQPL